MAISEASRHHMLTRLEETLGKESAMTLAEHLPPVGWADVATKHDLHELEARIDLRFDALDHRFESIDHRFESIDHRFESIDHRFDSIDHRFESIDHRFESIDHRFESLEARMSGGFESLRADLTAMVETKLRSQTFHMLLAYVGSLATFAALLIAAMRVLGA